MAVLTYPDVQNFIKYLRSLGYKFQYFVTGELGGRYSRTHWHIILHFQGRVPSHELNRRFSDRHVNDEGLLFKHDVCQAWPHGFMMWKKAEFQDVMYNCKYILKDADDEASQRKPGMSKKPPIGAEYFVQVADRHVEQHLAPQDLLYRHKGVNKKEGGPIEFKLSGRTAEMYLERFISRWKEVHGDKPRPKSDLVDLFEQYGKIVTDEKRMLLREEFPKGESRIPFPSAVAIKASAEEARAESAQWRQEMAEYERDKWSAAWVREGDNEQERQKRQQVVEFEQVEQQQQHEYEVEQYIAYRAQHGWDFVVGKGWVLNRPGPGNGGVEKFSVWVQKSKRLQPSGERQPVGLEDEQGRVGTWNAHYGKAAGENGPGKRRQDDRAGARAEANA
ncbi:MAG TPA: hypothetical protein VL147_10615 [Devosia sp.]|nr:hypothetical protein [Devosia sp.]